MSSNQYKVVRFHNISKHDFTHAFEGRPYFVKAGGRVLFPFDLADHLATHLARAILLAGVEGDVVLQSKDQHLWSEEAIAELKTKILEDVVEGDAPVVLTPQEQLAKRVEDLNRAEPDGNEGKLADPANYKDKADVIARMKELGLPFNPRASKATLERELAAAEKNVAK